MKRRNAPSKIHLHPPSPVHETPAEAGDKGKPSAIRPSGTTRVPLLKRKLTLESGGTLDPQVNISKDGRMQISAPSTPWHELDLSDSFMNAIHTAPVAPVKAGRWAKRRIWFVVGGLLGVFLGWLFTEGDPVAAFSNSDFNVDMQTFIRDLPSLTNSLGGALSINITEMLQPGREWLNSPKTSFLLGREAAARGQSKQFSVILVPGIISSGLESWSTKPEAAPFFRKRIWASTAMLRAIISSKDTWVAAMSLDPETGLDQGGYKVRAAQGLDAASTFMPGYWIWAKVIENLAALGYDHSDMELASYDWRLSNGNLEVRDQYFSRLRYSIELNLKVNKKKTVLVSHSMGAPVTLYFLKWVEADKFGAGGSNWVEEHIEAWVNVAGTLLGVPKAMSALLSGEMRDTVELNSAGVYLLEKYFSRAERAKLFRSWAGAASMMLKGGDDVWGDSRSAPDDLPNATLSGGNIFYFRSETHMNTSDVTAEHITPNLTLNDAINYVLEHVPDSYQRMLGANYSTGFERDEANLIKNNDDPRKWTNPLEVRLPNAPSMTIYCLYGTGKETERSYFYQQGGYEQDELQAGEENATCQDDACGDTTPRQPLDLPLSRRSWIDASVSLESQEPKVRSGVVFGDGDGTVSLLSLGAMCADGWKRDLYNPARIEVVTHEIKHEPLAFDVRGGPTTGDHVDILGSSEMNEAIMDVVTGHGERVVERFHSPIRAFAAKIRWGGKKTQQ